MSFVGLVIHPSVDKNLIDLIQDKCHPWSEAFREPVKYRQNVSIGNLAQFYNYMADPANAMLHLTTPEKGTPLKPEIDAYIAMIDEMGVRAFVDRYIASALGLEPEEVTWDNDGIHFMSDYNRNAKFNTLKLGFDKIPVIGKRDVLDQNGNQLIDKDGNVIQENYQFIRNTIWEEKYPLVTYPVQSVIDAWESFLLPEYLQEDVSKEDSLPVAFTIPSVVVEKDWYERSKKVEGGTAIVKADDWNRTILNLLKEVAEENPGHEVSFVQFTL